MPTLFISDLHLDDRRPETTDLMLKFLRDEAALADALYILGDLFEFWLGDDVRPQCAEATAKALKHLARAGVPCYFTHGNRDFLLRNDYAASAGLQLLPEEHVLELFGERVLLLHGDSLCTDDLAYQQFRQVARNPAWQQDILSKSPQERLQIALQARDASAAHKGSIEMDIMDVNPAEVKAAFKRHGVLRMIHGHTHRPAIHDLEIGGQKAQRIVLGDWYTQGSVLRAQGGRYELSTLAG